MMLSDLIRDLNIALQDHGDLEVLVNAEDGWNYALRGSIEKIYDHNGQRDDKKESKGKFNSLLLSIG